MGWETIKYANKRTMAIPEEEGEKGAEKIFEEIMAKTFQSVLLKIQTYNRHTHTHTSARDEF